MKRKVEIIDTSELKKSIPELENSKVEIYVDAENNKNKEEIYEMLKTAGAKKLRVIFACILRCDYLNHIYKKEAQGVAAIKFKGGVSKNQNIRIYCKELMYNGKKVVLFKCCVKKVQKNSQSPEILGIISDIQMTDY